MLTSIFTSDVATSQKDREENIKKNTLKASEALKKHDYLSAAQAYDAIDQEYQNIYPKLHIRKARAKYSLAYCISKFAENPPPYESRSALYKRALDHAIKAFAMFAKLVTPATRATQADNMNLIAKLYGRLDTVAKGKFYLKRSMGIRQVAFTTVMRLLYASERRKLIKPLQKCKSPLLFVKQGLTQRYTTSEYLKVGHLIRALKSWRRLSSTDFDATKRMLRKKYGVKNSKIIPDVIKKVTHEVEENMQKSRVD